MEQQETSRAQAAQRNRNALDWLNFFLADVKDGIGPFLAIFLTSSQHWDPGRAGIAPNPSRRRNGSGARPGRCSCGCDHLEAHFDRRKRCRGRCGFDCDGGLSRLLAGGVCARFERDRGCHLSLAVTAISLGIVGRKGFTSRVGRNEAWNHAGNVATAVIAGLAGYSSRRPPFSGSWPRSPSPASSRFTGSIPTPSTMTSRAARRKGQPDARSLEASLLEQAAALVHGSDHTLPFCQCGNASARGRKAQPRQAG